MIIDTLRKEYHEEICDKIIRFKNGIPNFADISSRLSCEISKGVAVKIGSKINQISLPGQTAGKLFGDITRDFLEKSFGFLQHIRPGNWLFSTNQMKNGIACFEQYEHLSRLDDFFKKYKELEIDLGREYLVIPDIVIGRHPLTDGQINKNEIVVSHDEKIANLTDMRVKNCVNPKPILHASISCKWTIRSDRSQNTRTEALNLIRNRKGKTPHIVAVTAEPLPTRISSLALGTGDIDCVYHFALHELADVIRQQGEESQSDMLEHLIKGKRLRDISDLPFDLTS
jgi:hypothetical protein